MLPLEGVNLARGARTPRVIEQGDTNAIRMNLEERTILCTGRNLVGSSSSIPPTICITSGKMNKDFLQYNPDVHSFFLGLKTEVFHRSSGEAFSLRAFIGAITLIVRYQR